MKRVVIAVVGGVALAALLLVGRGQASNAFEVFLAIVTKQSSPAGSGVGTLTGQVRIGPLCPVEPCPAPTPDPYSSRKLVLQPPLGTAISLPLDSSGRFRGDVPAGQYTVTLTDCTFLGCARALPRPVDVVQGATTTLEITIDTGIR